ncbi:MAG: hypothetical protein IEMM0001_0825 [bacterium]|nr:MAG: hypothetical protein IEMM0001_0825 [bacterium]
MINNFMNSSWGSEDSTRTAMLFEHSNALAKARRVNGKKTAVAGTIPGFPISFVGD